MPNAINGFPASNELICFSSKLANPLTIIIEVKIAHILSNYCQQSSLSAHRL